MNLLAPRGPIDPVYQKKILGQYADQQVKDGWWWGVRVVGVMGGVWVWLDELLVSGTGLYNHNKHHIYLSLEVTYMLWKFFIAHIMNTSTT